MANRSALLKVSASGSNTQFENYACKQLPKSYIELQGIVLNEWKFDGLVTLLLHESVFYIFRVYLIENIQQAKPFAAYYSMSFDNSSSARSVDLMVHHRIKWSKIHSVQKFRIIHKKKSPKALLASARERKLQWVWFELMTISERGTQRYSLWSEHTRSVLWDGACSLSSSRATSNFPGARFALLPG